MNKLFCLWPGKFFYYKPIPSQSSWDKKQNKTKTETQWRFVTRGLDWKLPKIERSESYYFALSGELAQTNTRGLWDSWALKVLCHFCPYFSNYPYSCSSFISVDWQVTKVHNSCFLLLFGGFTQQVSSVISFAKSNQPDSGQANLCQSAWDKRGHMTHNQLHQNTLLAQVCCPINASVRED